MSLVIRSDFNGVTDPDAGAYIAAVENADVQPLEFAVGKAINDFVVGCKADGIWNAIKASCILAGARTLQGALVPLAGTAPTPFNFVPADYNRKTGLVGNAVDKYINSNRLNTADPQDSYHQSVYATTSQSLGTKFYIGGQGNNPDCTNDIYRDSNNGIKFRNRADSAMATGPAPTTTGFLGTTRNSSTGFTYRAAGSNVFRTVASQSPGSSQKIYVLSRNLNGSSNFPGDARIAFYSIGENIDLALLDARVTALINAFGAAIP